MFCGAMRKIAKKPPPQIHVCVVLWNSMQQTNKATDPGICLIAGLIVEQRAAVSCILILGELLKVYNRIYRRFIQRFLKELRFWSEPG